jgi:hypothetical protein
MHIFCFISLKQQSTCSVNIAEEDEKSKFKRGLIVFSHLNCTILIKSNHCIIIYGTGGRIYERPAGPFYGEYRYRLDSMAEPACNTIDTRAICTMPRCTLPVLSQDSVLYCTFSVLTEQVTYQ